MIFCLPYFLKQNKKVTLYRRLQYCSAFSSVPFFKNSVTSSPRLLRVALRLAAAIPTEAVTNPAHNIPIAKASPDDLDAAATSDVCLPMTGTAAAAITMAADAIVVDFTWVSASKNNLSQQDGTFVKLANFPQRVTPSQVPPARKSRPVREWRGVFASYVKRAEFVYIFF